MPSESLHDTPSPHDSPVSSADSAEPSDDTTPASVQLPVDLSQFSQRLASFGLGEAPDPLLTESRPAGKRRPRRAVDRKLSESDHREPA
jgi:hypothetical protein